MRALVKRDVAGRRQAAARPSAMDRSPVTTAPLDAARTPVEWLETLADLQLRILALAHSPYARPRTDEEYKILTMGPAPYTQPSMFASVGAP